MPDSPSSRSEESERRASLRRMRLVALAFLVGAAVLFVVSEVALRSGGHAAWGYVRAAAEAGMVGGLADWFAVTALFRHPLGLPIPHTALVPRRKDELATSLADFVGEHFLTESAIAERIRSAQVVPRVGRWAASDSGVALIDQYATDVMRRAIAVMRDETVRPIVADIVMTRAQETDIAPVLGRVLDELLADGTHRKAFDVTIDAVTDWALVNRSVVREAIMGRSPEWTPRWVDEMVADKLYKEILKGLDEVATNPRHKVRLEFEQRLAKFAEDLRTDDEVRARVEQAKLNLLSRNEVQQAMADVATAGRRIALEMLEDSDSVLRVQLRAFVRDIGNRLATSAEVAQTVERQLISVAGPLVVEHRADITALVTETIQRWDGTEAADRIETHVGRDLQFIRINGTLVGAVVGLVLHTITHVV